MGIYKPVNPTASPIIRRPVGRPPLFGRAMTDREKKQRSRWMKAFLNKILDRYSVKVETNFIRDAPADVVGNTLAYACFDMTTKTANYERWNEINEKVLDQLVRLERDFA